MGLTSEQAERFTHFAQAAITVRNSEDFECLVATHVSRLRKYPTGAASLLTQGLVFR